MQIRHVSVNPRLTPAIATKRSVAADAAQSLGDHLAEIKAELAAMRELITRLEAERDEYK